MDTSEQINEIAGALAKAQSAMGHAVKDRTNPHMRNKYATLAAVIDAARPHLSAQGVCIVQSATLADDRVAVVTLLAHSSGQWLRATTCLPPTALSTKGATGLDAQSVGSTITYAKRYGLMAMLGISAEDEDDDGNAASRPATKEEAPKPVQPKDHVLVTMLEKMIAEATNKADLEAAGGAIKDNAPKITPQGMMHLRDCYAFALKGYKEAKAKAKADPENWGDPDAQGD